MQINGIWWSNINPVGASVGLGGSAKLNDRYTLSVSATVYYNMGWESMIMYLSQDGGNKNLKLKDGEKTV